jgi:hypothetical protein
MTRSRLCVLLAVGAGLGLWASPAAAQLQPLGATLYTPPLWADHFVCTVVNTSSTTLLVSAKILDAAGGALSTSPIAGGCTPSTLAPGQACGVIAPSTYMRLAYCRITLTPGTKQDVRGSLYGSQFDGLSAVTVPAQ